ncbi:DUF3558 family protein [Streptomyces sp. NPDC127068]|uniref:DUF3558 family protein n=1 Tax=Streptomyces sp. NPDC127068 TaxID=3347127 RepID=UPI0036666D2E
MHRPAQRLTRALVCAATATVIIGAAGCSSDSGSDSGSDDAKKGSGSSAPASGSTTPDSAPPPVEEAAYAKLPDPCETLSKTTRGELAPKGGAGKASTSDDTATRGTCSWSSLDNNGVKGSQFRWLNVSLLRFESDQNRGSGAKLAKEYLGKQVADAQGTSGAKKLATSPLSGTGDEAQRIAYDLKKKEGTFKQNTVVARVENVVVTVDYNGAGLAGDATPSAETLTKAAQKATKEAVAAVIAANEQSADADKDSKNKKNDKGDKGDKGSEEGKTGGGSGSGISRSPDKSKPQKAA